MLLTRTMPSFDFGKASGEMANAAAVKPVRRRNFALVSMVISLSATRALLRQPPHHHAAGRSTIKLQFGSGSDSKQTSVFTDAKAATFEAPGFVVR